MAAVLAVAALPVWAEAPETSIRPLARPARTAEVTAQEVVPAATATATATTATTDAAPEAAPATAVDAAAQAALDAVREAASVPLPESSAGMVTSSPFPRARPQAGAMAPEQSAPQTAAETAPTAAPQERRGLFAGLFGAPRPRPDRNAAAPTPRGNGICGNPALTGQAMPTIRSRTNGCGVEEPVQITAVDGIQLSIASTMDCATANALAAWVDTGLRPAFQGEQIVGLQVAGHYICRTRNHRSGARISEHGRGKAIDISGIILAGGRVLTVAGNWNRQMRAAYRAGCGIFGTTLGPGSDGYHEDHMHFDTANHRNGPYCR